MFALNQLEGTSSRLRNLGACELVVNALQRQAKLPQGVRAAALALGSLAKDAVNRKRLGENGGCDAVLIGKCTYICMCYFI